MWLEIGVSVGWWEQRSLLVLLILRMIFLQLLLKKSRVLCLMGFRVFIQKRDDYQIVCEVAAKLTTLRTLTNEKCKNTEIECLLIIMIFKCKYTWRAKSRLMEMFIDVNVIFVHLASLSAFCFVCFAGWWVSVHLCLIRSSLSEECHAASECVHECIIHFECCVLVEHSHWLLTFLGWWCKQLGSSGCSFLFFTSTLCYMQAGKALET